MKASECMCNNVCAIKPNLTINEVAKLMGEKHIGCIPVCDDENCICGIVTDRDLVLRTIACEKDPKTTPVSEIMTCDVCTCKKDEEMSNVVSKMSQNQIRRIPVCDCNNHVVGILTLGDLAKNEDITNQQVVNTFENICNCNHKNAE